MTKHETDGGDENLAEGLKCFLKLRFCRNQSDKCVSSQDLHLLPLNQHLIHPNAQIE